MLNAKQEAFCLHYAKTGNATEAYKVAYKTTSRRSAESAGNRLLQKVEIRNRIGELTKEAHSAAIADVAEMQARLTAILRQEAEEEVVTVTGKIIKKKASTQDAIRAITQLAKMQGVAENVNVNISIPVIAGDAELED